MALQFEWHLLHSSATAVQRLQAIGAAEATVTAPAEGMAARGYATQALP